MQSKTQIACNISYSQAFLLQMVLIMILRKQCLQTK